MDLDVYGLTRQRDMATLNGFLDEYVDWAANADRGDEELMLEPLDAHSGETAMQWEREPSLTLSHILERGLAHPRRAFATYLTCLPACQKVGIDWAILGFTRDDQLVLGLSLHSRHVEEGDEALAHEILAHFAEVYRCHLGLILLETPPPMSEAEFRQAAETLPVVFPTSFDA